MGSSGQTSRADKVQDLPRAFRLNRFNLLQRASADTRLYVCDLAKPRLLPLRAISWQFSQNPQFARLRIRTDSDRRATMLKYVERYGVVGHSHDLDLRLGDQVIRAHRPICVKDGRTYLIFEFLVHGLLFD